MNEQETAKRFTVEDVGKFFTDMFSACKSCAHNNVCKKIEERKDTTELCTDFLNAGNYKTYGNIYDMFQPIFDWIEFHYPSHDVKFIVDYASAQMYIEHKVYAFKKNMVSAFLEPPKHGSWIKKDGKQFCSVCGNVVAEDEDENTTKLCLYHYCPHCGAVMDGELNAKKET